MKFNQNYNGVRERNEIVIMNNPVCGKRMDRFIGRSVVKI